MAFDGVPKFSPSRFGVAVCGQPLKHSFSSKVGDTAGGQGFWHADPVALYRLERSKMAECGERSW
jgi:hypothetical protein